MGAFQEIKLAIASATGLSNDALHIYVGLTVMLSLASILRQGLQSTIPWLAVLSVAVTLELPDMHANIGSPGYWRWSSSLHDIINTMFWPSVLMLLAYRGMLVRLMGAPPGAPADQPK